MCGWRNPAEIPAIGNPGHFAIRRNTAFIGEPGIRTACRVEIQSRGSHAACSSPGVAGHSLMALSRHAERARYAASAAGRGRQACASWFGPLFGLLAWGAFVPAASAAFEADETSWEGYSQVLDLARQELGSDRVRILSSLDYSVLSPGDALVFVHPEVEIRFHPLAAFLAAGGRAAVIDDYGEAAALLERFHIHRANPPALPALRVRDNSNLPIALPAGAEALDGEPSEHPTLRGVDQVVTNHPTALRLEPGIELTRLLSLPARGEPEALLAVTGVIGDARACGLTARAGAEVPPAGRCGRLLAMADPSAFINLMLRYPGNRNFARGVIKYLLEDDTWGRRGGNLYFLTGEFRQTGSYGSEGGWRESLTEQETALREWIRNVRSEGLPEPFSIAIAAIAAIGVAIWAGLAGGQLYAPAPPGYARGVALDAQGGFAGRFAVLSGLSSDRALILLELKRALEASLRQRLSLPEAANTREIVASAAQGQLLKPETLRALSLLLQRLSAGEVAVLNARRLSVSDRALRGLNDGVLDILAEMKDQEKPTRDSRSQQ